jgi:hypothetical protein
MGPAAIAKRLGMSLFGGTPAIRPRNCGAVFWQNITYPRRPRSNSRGTIYRPASSGVFKLERGQSEMPDDSSQIQETLLFVEDEALTQMVMLRRLQGLC